MPLVYFFYFNIISGHYLPVSIFAQGHSSRREKRKEEQGKRGGRGGGKSKLGRHRRGRLIEVEEGKGGTIHREGERARELKRKEGEGGEVIF